MPEAITVYAELGSYKSGFAGVEHNTSYSYVREKGTSDYYWSDYWTNSVRQRSQQPTGGPYVINRAFLYFDTSAIPAGATILSATLYMTQSQTYVANWSSFKLVIQKGTNTAYPHYPYEESDYSYLKYEGNCGELNISSLPSAEDTYVITLSDLSVVVPNGITKFVLRTNTDIAGTPPPNKKSEAMSFYHENENLSKRCYMVITYEEITISVTTNAATQIDYNCAIGNGTIVSGTNATERGFEIVLNFGDYLDSSSGTLLNYFNHSIAGFEGDVTWDIVYKWNGVLTKTEKEEGDFAEGAYELVLGYPSASYDVWGTPDYSFDDKLFKCESYTYRAYAIIDGVTYYGEYVAFSTLCDSGGEQQPEDDISAGNPVVPIIPIVPVEPIEIIMPEEEFPELELPEFELPEFDYPDFPPYNGSWLGQFYYRKAYTKKDLDELRRKCRIFQDNSVEYALVLNHNAAVLQQFLNMMTEYLDADEYNTFRDIIPAQHLNELERKQLDVLDFKEIINNFIRNSIDNANNVNNNFHLIRSGLSAYTYTEDEGFKDIKITTREVDDNNPDVDRLKKVIDKLNLDMSSNYETINHNLHVLKAMLF